MSISIPKRHPNIPTNKRNVTRPMFILTKQAQIIVLRQEPGEYVDGRWVEPKENASLIMANVQPMRGHELLSLPESDRSSDSIKVYSRERLHTIEEVGSIHADHVVWDGKKYQAYKTLTYQMGVLDHTKTLCIRVPETPNNMSEWVSPLGMLGVDGADGMSSETDMVGGLFVDQTKTIPPIV